MNRARAADLLISQHGGPKVDHREQFIPGRYPYTYACDYFRSQTRGCLSRGEASGLIRTFAAKANLEADDLFVELADRYLDNYGVDASLAARANALLEKGRRGE